MSLAIQSKIIVRNHAIDRLEERLPLDQIPRKLRQKGNLNKLSLKEARLHIIRCLKKANEVIRYRYQKNYRKRRPQEVTISIFEGNFFGEKIFFICQLIDGDCPDDAEKILIITIYNEKIMRDKMEAIRCNRSNNTPEILFMEPGLWDRLARQGQSRKGTNDRN